jgi:hypothetical protein
MFADDAAEDGPTFDPLSGEVGDRVIGPGRMELAAAMGSPSVVVGHDRPQILWGAKRLVVPLTCSDEEGQP